LFASLRLFSSSFSLSNFPFKQPIIYRNIRLSRNRFAERTACSGTAEISHPTGQNHWQTNLQAFNVLLKRKNVIAKENKKLTRISYDGESPLNIVNNHF